MYDKESKPTLKSAPDAVNLRGVLEDVWTSNNPGGSDEHFGVVHYGTDRKEISQTAKSHIRLNQNHPYTVFRVRMDGLASGTTYYYTVESVRGDGTPLGGRSNAINQFTTHQHQ